ncbi:MAG: type II toxin-antitoxin system VapC family toxin [Anaerolineales bacterium]|nr:type II toxin-antitoxin system VapC family toxin [Anaerolineales bacterium]MCX7753620.1 type II toxin-antitoxin system VapC family toxin [Anaerolineales bacterium]MDW8278180.1 type II toxin-antitoxin system VapC family toxin [Anaerolineales bacterium]
MTTHVLDAYALMVFFEDEPGADTIRQIMESALEKGDALMMSVVNLGEVWYAIARSNSPEVADRYVEEIHRMGIEIINPDWALTRQAAIFKVRGKLSYADCFAAALSALYHAPLVTGDKEFESLQKDISILWV